MQQVLRGRRRGDHGRRSGTPDGGRSQPRSGLPRQDGQSLVDFALVAPMIFLLVLGLVVAGIVVMNQTQLTNASRDGARAAAVCGGAGTRPGSTTLLPNGKSCTSANVIAYTAGRVQAFPGGIQPQITVKPGNSSDISQCVKGETITVTVTYHQPLYVPLVGKLFGADSNNDRTLSATATATCEQ